MAKKLSVEEKQQFIDLHKDLVPAKSLDSFLKKDVDNQYTLISTYIRKEKEKETIQGKVKQYLKGSNVKASDVKDLIQLCNKWLEKNKTKLINDVDEQIKKLEEERKKLYNL